MKVYFTNFWDGFYNCTDANHAQFFIELFTKAFGEKIEVGSFEDSEILCESIFGYPILNKDAKKKFKYTVLFSGESRLNGLEDYYDIVLYGERNHKNRVNCPLFVPYRWCNSYLPTLASQQLRNVHQEPQGALSEGTPQPTRFITPPKLDRVLCVIGNDGGEFRNQYLDRMERRGIKIDYAGSYRKSVRDPRIENTRYWQKEYLQAMGEYKFVLAMENSKGDTYITEKIVNPLEAGSIPIYWGSERIGDYFNKDRCIFVGNSPKEQEESIDEIERLLNNQEAYMSKLIQPSILDDWRTIDDIARDIQSITIQSPGDLLSSISNIRIISAPEFEPKRYSNMVEMMKRLGVHPSKYLIDAKTYKHTITPEQYNYYVKHAMMDLLPWVGPFRRTKRSELSLILNLYWHLLDLDRRYKDGIFLTHESDVLERDNITEFPKFMDIIKNARQQGVEWSLISVGYGPKEDNAHCFKGVDEFLPYHVVQKTNTRGTDSLIWTKKAIEQFLVKLKEEDYSEPFDHYLGRYAEENKDFLFFWSEPAFYSQQSAYGNDSSTIQSDEY